MNKKVFQTDLAPQAIGPYSQAIESNGFLFLSGQIPIDPKTNQLIPSPQQVDTPLAGTPRVGTDSGTAIADQTKRVLQNIEALLLARHLSLSHIVKTTLFLKNMSDFPLVNEIYGSFFKENPPARSTVEVSRLPKDVLIEIEAIATLI